MRILPFLYRCLIVCFIILSLVFIGGTIYGVFFNTAPQPQRHGQIGILHREEGQTFTGIGQLRVSTADPQPGMVIIFVTFVYYPDDRAFSEELVLRIRDFREIIVDYIGSFSISELQVHDEEEIKTEILRRLNFILRLGQIEALFFSDFMIIG